MASANATNQAPTAPPEWDVWEPQVSYGPSMTTYSRWAEAADPDSWPWTVPSSKTSLVVIAVRGVDIDNPRDAAAVAASLETGFPATPSITTQTDGALVVTFGGTIGPSGDLDIRWTSDGTVDGRATSQLSGTTNSSTVATSRLVATAGTVTPTLAPVESVGRGGVLVFALRPAS